MAKSPKKNTSNLKPWESGQSGNPNGRPKRVVSSIISELREKGYDNVKPSQVENVFELLLNLPKDELLDLWGGKEDVPILVATVARELTKSDKAYEVIEKMLDRAHGKATNKTQVEHSGKVDLPAWLSGSIDNDETQP